MTTRRIADLAFTLLLLVLVGYVVVSAQGWPPGARLFPTVVGTIMGLVLIAQLVKSGMEIRRHTGGSEARMLWPDADPAVARRRATQTTLTVVGVALSVWILGFPIGGPFALAVHLFLVVRERALVSTLITLGSVAFLWAMSVLLRVPFAEPLVPFLSNPF